MKLIYIAGPFRAKNSWKTEKNIRKAEKLALKVWRSGAACICPHTNTRFFDGAADDDIWLNGDLEILSRCDALLTTNNWKNSQGARYEVRYALEENIPIFHDFDALKEWLNIGE